MEAKRMRVFLSTTCLLLTVTCWAQKFSEITPLQRVAFMRGGTHIQFFDDAKRALVLMPARVVATGAYVQHAVSPDGRYIGWLVMEATMGELVEWVSTPGRTTADFMANMPKVRLFVYDRQTRTAEFRVVLPGTRSTASLYSLDSNGSFLVSIWNMTTDGTSNGSTIYTSIAGQPGLRKVMDVP